ncbi:MAG: FtsW/RodA/SpoVE family cell cycle protein, partial [Sediminibacterium sp.]|nr:FtsW/RodA/SpoVE family cell cycle protein [Sediminibacterium sp.]
LNYIIFSRIAFMMFVLSIILLIYTQFWGIKINEGRRWLKIPILNFTIQTSDFAKLFLYIYISKLLSQNQDQLQDFKKGYLKILIPVLIICFLIAMSNLSNAVITFTSSLILLYIGRAKLKHILLTVTIAIIPLIILVSLAFLKHQAYKENQTNTTYSIPVFNRLNIWVNRIHNFIFKEAPQRDDYQMVQAKIAIANGGLLLGLGPGNSQQKNFLPQAYNDFVFAIIIEEYGVVGGFIILFLYLAFLFRCILIINRCKYMFGTFLAIALSFTIILQAAANILVCVDLFPVTGVTLPLISLGGTSFMFTSLAIGIILSIDRFNDLPEVATSEISSENKEINKEKEITKNNNILQSI